jgi:ribosomal protein S21
MQLANTAPFMVYLAPHMINAEVQKSGTESVLSTIRKFSRKVQGTGLIKNARKIRYYSRDMSPAVKKKRALKLIKRRADFRQLVKEGKAEERSPRRFNKERETPQQAPRSTPGSGLGENTPIAR